MREIKPVKEHICKIEPWAFRDSMEMFDTNDLFDADFIVLKIGELVYDDHIIQCIFKSNYDRDVKEITPEIIRRFTLGYFEDDGESYWGYSTKSFNRTVNDIEDKELMNNLVDMIMEAYAEFLIS